MSIFDNVKQTPKSEAIDLVIALRYGPIRHTTEYFERLPDAVIEASCQKVKSEIRFAGTGRQVLSIMLRQPVNKEAAHKAITESLREYHLLFG